MAALPIKNLAKLATTYNWSKEEEKDVSNTLIMMGIGGAALGIMIMGFIMTTGG